MLLAIFYLFVLINEPSPVGLLLYWLITINRQSKRNANGHFEVSLNYETCAAIFIALFVATL